jgi:hypothetical protein
LNPSVTGGLLGKIIVKALAATNVFSIKVS